MRLNDETSCTLNCTTVLVTTNSNRVGKSYKNGNTTQPLTDNTSADWHTATDTFTLGYDAQR